MFAVVQDKTPVGLNVIATRRLERLTWQGGVLQLRAIVSARFGGVDAWRVRGNSRFFVVQVGLSSAFAAIKTPGVFTNRRRPMF